jgi:hypothetical protein
VRRAPGGRPLGIKRANGNGGIFLRRPVQRIIRKVCCDLPIVLLRRHIPNYVVSIRRGSRFRLRARLQPSLVVVTEVSDLRTLCYFCQITERIVFVLRGVREPGQIFFDRRGPAECVGRGLQRLPRRVRHGGARRWPGGTAII